MAEPIWFTLAFPIAVAILFVVIIVILAWLTLKIRKYKKGNVSDKDSGETLTKQEFAEYDLNLEQKFNFIQEKMDAHSQKLETLLRRTRSKNMSEETVKTNLYAYAESDGVIVIRRLNQEIEIPKSYIIAEEKQH